MNTHWGIGQAVTHRTVRNSLAAFCGCLLLANFAAWHAYRALSQEHVRNAAMEVNASIPVLAQALDGMVRAYDRQQPEVFEAQYWTFIYEKGRMNSWCGLLQSESELDAAYPNAFWFLMTLSAPETEPVFPTQCYNAETVEQINRASGFLHGMEHDSKKETIPLEKTMQKLEAALEQMDAGQMEEDG